MKKIMSLMLAVVLLFSMVCPVLADGQSPFLDVAGGKYYTPSVLEMYEDGVVDGYGNGYFGPADPITRIQVIVMILRLAGVDTEDFSGDEKWYSDAASWARAAGIVAADTDVTAHATREEIGQYIAAIYQLTPSVNEDGFVDTDSIWANTLKDYGIAVGTTDKDGKIIYGGEQKVKRCDVCVMLCRLKYKAETPTWDHIVPGMEQEQAAGPVESPKTLDDYTDTLRYMMKNGMRAYTFVFAAEAGKSYTAEEAEAIRNDLKDNIQTARWEVKKSDPAYESFYGGCTIRFAMTGYGSQVSRMEARVCFELEDNLTQKNLLWHIRAYEAEVAKTLQALYAAGTLSDTMTQKEKAQALFGYVAERYTYDMEYLGANAYHASQNDRAVCEGYVDLYASLCEGAGVAMRAVYSDDHAWNYTEVDGVRYHIDVTWGDQVTWLDRQFFWMTDSDLQRLDPGRTVVGGY